MISSQVLDLMRFRMIRDPPKDVFFDVFKPVHIVSDDHPGVVPLDNEVGIEGDREIFVGHLCF